MNDLAANSALSQSLISTRALHKLSKTAMEMIEQETKFARCIGRLADVLYGDDPSFQDIEFAKSESEPKNDGEKAVSDKSDDDEAQEMQENGSIGDTDSGGDLTYAELQSIREVVQETFSCYNEVVSRLSSTRAKLLRLRAQKKALARKLIPDKIEDYENKGSKNLLSDEQPKGINGLPLDGESGEDFSDRIW
ncbi:hypothetical protein HK096_010653 [Nowakowskiella sp. JEL0078]|nr:hypothetical protein HK096_010653 [Nowakowskiella sp. JEL0078]